MSLGSLLKRLSNALPVALAAAPGVIDALKQVKKALKKPKKPAGDGADAAPANGARP